MKLDDPPRYRLTMPQLIGIAIMIPGMLWFAWESASPGEENRFLPLACGVGGLLLLVFMGPPAAKEEQAGAPPAYADDDINGTVELRDAVGWTCEICGRDNFQEMLQVPRALHDAHDRAVLQEICDISNEAAREGEGPGEIDAEAAFSIFQVPTHVRCHHCTSRFVAERAAGGDEAEEKYGS